MPAPTITCEIAWGSAPNAASPSWTNVTSRLRSFRLQRGRNHELDDVQAGSLTLVFANKDRRFDPAETGYTAGPYGSNVKVRTKVRITTTFNSVTRNLMYSYITAFQPRLEPDNSDAEMVIRCIDGMSVLSRAKVSGDYPQEKTHLRIGRVLDAIGWPAADRTLDSGNEVIETQATTVSGASALSHIQQIVKDERGLFFIDRHGFARFRNRRYRLSPLTANYVTLGDAGGSEQYYGDLQYSLDDSQILNDMTVTAAGGIPQNVSDATSQADFWPNADSRSGLHALDADAYGEAFFMVEKYKRPRLRSEQLVIKGELNPNTMWEKIVAADLGEKLRVLRRPPGGGAAIDQTMFLEGFSIDWKAEAARWDVVWNVSPGDSTQYWVLGDATYGVLGSTTRVSY